MSLTKCFDLRYLHAAFLWFAAPQQQQQQAKSCIRPKQNLAQSANEFAAKCTRLYFLSQFAVCGFQKQSTNSRIRSRVAILATRAQLCLLCHSRGDFQLAAQFAACGLRKVPRFEAACKIVAQTKEANKLPPSLKSGGSNVASLPVLRLLKEASRSKHCLCLLAAGFFWSFVCQIANCYFWLPSSSCNVLK